MRGRHRYARAVRRAVATVPYYRERYAATGTLPPLTRDEAELRRHLLMPLGAALLAQRDPGRPAAEHIAELHEALRLAGHRTGGREVYEVAPALRDPVRAHGTDWRVVLASTAETVDADEATDAGRYVTAHPTPARNALVVGEAGQLTGPATTNGPGPWSASPSRWPPAPAPLPVRSGTSRGSATSAVSPQTAGSCTSTPTGSTPGCSTGRRC